MIQKVLLPCLILLFAQALSAQSTLLRGRVTDAETAIHLPDASVVLSNTGKVAATGTDGRFMLEDVTPGKYIIIISHAGYLPLEVEIIVKADVNPATDYTLRRDPNVITNPIISTGDIPTVSLDEADSETDGASEVANVLSASRDVFQQVSGYGWSPFRFRERGYDGAFFLTYVNGVPFNDLETGFTSYGELGGLNDVVRLRSSTVGLDASEFAFGGIGGATMIDTRASSQRKQIRVSYASSNRTYTNRVMATMNTGLMPGGWAVSVSGSHRWAQQGYVDGTFMDAWAYFLGIDKKFNLKNNLSLTVFGAPTKRGRSADSFQEMFDISGSNYYNPLWGYWNGDKRNASVTYNHQPTAVLRYDWTPSIKTSVIATVYGQKGRSDFGRLNFINGSNPNPDYNRRLPSSLEDSTMIAMQAELLGSSENARQIDWAALYEANQYNPVSVENAYGQAGNTITGKNSIYILENQRSDNTETGANVIVNHTLNPRLALNGGAQYHWYRGENYKIVDDLLGGDFWTDWDFFGNFDGQTNPLAQNSDLQVPNNVVYKGDIFGYNYNENISKADAWAQLQYSLAKFEVFIAAEGAQTSMSRTGLMQSGRFPDNSLGKSNQVDFNTYTLKGGLTWKVNGRNYLYVNGLYGTRAPLFRNTFVSPRTRDLVVPNIEVSKVQSIEGGYLLRSPKYKARVTAYMTDFLNETENIFASAWSVGRVLGELDLGALGFGSDDKSLEQPIFFGSAILQGVNRRHAGIEAAIEAKPVPSWVFTAATSLGKYIYTNRPKLAISLDNGSSAVPIIDAGVIYQENFYVPRTPQKTGALSIRHEGKDFWFASLTLNYAADFWYEFDRVRRTSRFVSGLTPDMPIWGTIIDQQKAPSAYTLDLFGGKSWRIRAGKDAYFVALNVGVNNILNKQNIVISGRESYRNAFRNDVSDPRFYTTELLYAYGTNYFASITLRMQ